MPTYFVFMKCFKYRFTIFRSHIINHSLYRFWTCIPSSINYYHIYIVSRSLIRIETVTCIF